MSNRSYNDVKNTIITIINNISSISVTKPYTEAELSDDLILHLDSIDTVEVISKIEDEFRIEIPDGNAAHMKTIEDLVNYVCERNNIKIPKKTKKVVPTKPVNPAVLVIKKELVNKK